MIEHLALILDLFEHEFGVLIVYIAAPFHSDTFILLLILLVEVLLDVLQILLSILEVFLLSCIFAVDRRSLLL